MANSPQSLRVLVGLDSIEHTLTIIKFLTNQHYHVEYLRVDTPLGIMQALHNRWDIFICDIHLASLSEQDFFKTMSHLAISMPLMLLCHAGEQEDIAVDALAIGALDVITLTELNNIVQILDDLRNVAAQDTSLSTELMSCDDMPVPVLLLDSQWRCVHQNLAAKRLNIDVSVSQQFFDIWVADSQLTLRQQLQSFSVGDQADEIIGSIHEPLALEKLAGRYFVVKVRRVHSSQSSQYILILDEITRDVAIYNSRIDEQKRLKEHYSNTLSRVSESQKRDADTLIAKTQFLSQVGHEIRTPMNAISGFADALNRRPLDAESKMLANRISRASSMLLSVVNDLLDFSKIEANQLQIQSEPFFLNDVLDDLAFIMSGSAKAKHLELSIVAPPQQFTYLEGDDLRLKQILINLAANAIKFTEQGSVALDVREVKREQGNICYRFTIKDTGIGMSSEQILKIMQPFVQANVDISRRYGGTGLGLSICRSLVEKMGGELKVTSKLHQGSSFYFELNFPLLPYPQDKLQKISGVKVLIADDNPIALKGLEATVASMNWQPTIFNSGSELLEKLANHPEWHGPHCLVLLDWKMPHIDGFATAEKIHQLLPPEKRPIIFMVTSRESELLLNNEEAQFVDRILDKPLSPGGLYDAMLSLMNVRSYVSSDVSSKRLANFHIFVVEDSDLNVELIKTILIDEGASLDIAMTGQEALVKIKATDATIDVVLLDLQLPDIEGFEVAEQLRQFHDAEALPIIAMTARESSEDRQKAKQVGMNDWVGKPINRERLVLLIQQYGKQRMQKNGQDNHAKIDGASRFVRLRWERLPVINSKSVNIVTHERAVYQSLLQKFLNAYSEPLAQLQAGSLTDQDVNKLAHKLRGGSLSLGLERLSELCLVYEEYVAKIIKYRPSNDDLATILKQSIDTVRSMLSEEATRFVTRENTPQLDREQLEACLNKGITSLESHDLQQIQPFLEQLDEIGMGQLLNDVNHQLDDFDFSGAVRVVRNEAKIQGLLINADAE
ncbi:MAG TPA: response regulator [Pseudomonadales bacterium]|nr:response regulator [Pseudomonadales bacterium]